MAFEYLDPYVFRNGEFNSVIGSVLSFNDLIPAISGGLSGGDVAPVAIGNTIAIAAGITATAGDDWVNKVLRLNLSAFGGFIGYQNNNYWRAAAPPVASGGVFFPAVYVGSNEILHRKIGVYVFRANESEVGVLYILKITADLLEEVKGQNITNYDRLLKSAFISTAGLLQNSAASVYKTGGPAYFSIRADIVDADSNLLIGTAKNPINFDKALKMPIAASFYEAFPGGAAGRYISEITSETAGTIAAGLPQTVAATKSTNTAFLSLDPQYDITAAALSPIENNRISITVAGPSYPGATINDPLSSIRAILIRTDNIQNSDYFFNDCEGAEGVIPALQAGPGVIDGAIETPSRWSEDLTEQETYINFEINGSELAPGGEYRIIINTYDTASERVSSHISPPLVVSYVLAIIPPLTSTLGEYCEEYGSDVDLIIAPGGRVNASLTIDIDAYNAAAAAAGYPNGFIFSVKSVFATLPGLVSPDFGSVSEGVIFGIVNTLTDNASLVITPAEATISAVFRISPERAGTATPILWEIRILQADGLGGFEEVIVKYNQYITIRDFDTAPPDVLINTEFFRASGYPATKTPALNICDLSEIIAEITKDAGSDNGETVAVLYPVPTPPDGIEEEASIVPAFLPPEVSPFLSGLLPFSGPSNFYTIKADLLALDTCYNLITILRQKPAGVDYCPLLAPAPPAIPLGDVEKILTGPDWRILSDLTVLYAYVVSLSVPFAVTVNQVEDPVSGLPIGSGLIWGNPSIDPARVYVSIPTAITSARLRYEIEFTIDLGSGPHLVRLSVNEVIAAPVSPGPWDPVPVLVSCLDTDF